jgi:hypothetical protein
MTPEQKDWLDDLAPTRHLSTAEVFEEFMKEFSVTPEEAGRIIAEWLLERAARQQSLP